MNFKALLQPCAFWKLCVWTIWDRVGRGTWWLHFKRQVYYKHQSVSRGEKQCLAVDPLILLLSDVMILGSMNQSTQCPNVTLKKVNASFSITTYNPPRDDFGVSILYINCQLINLVDHQRMYLFFVYVLYGWSLFNNTFIVKWCLCSMQIDPDCFDGCVEGGGGNL